MLPLLLIVVGAVYLTRHLHLRDVCALLKRCLAGAKTGVRGGAHILVRRPERPAVVVERRASLAEVAFDYQRAVLDLDIGEEVKLRALHLVSRAIVPLVGSVMLDEVTLTLELGTAQVLRQQFPIDPQGVVYVWHDLLRWGRRSSTVPPSDDAGGGYRGLADLD